MEKRGLGENIYPLSKRLKMGLKSMLAKMLTKFVIL